MAQQTRCDDTEMLVDQCACAKHRGEPAEEKPHATSSFQAQWDGTCAGCGTGFRAGEWVGFDSNDRLLCDDCLEDL